MYNKDQAKEVRQQFWNSFKSWSGGKRFKLGLQGKWMMNDTGMRQVRLKFHFDEECALVAIEIDTRNLDKRIDLWEKFESLKPRLNELANFPLQWELEHQIIGEKTVSRIYDKIGNVNIYDKSCWKMVNEFFYTRMMVFESFYQEYKDYLKYG